MRRLLIGTIAVCMGAALVACGGGGKGIKLGERHEAGDDATYSIEAADQTSNGKALKVPEVHFKDEGYIAIHADDNGKPGSSILGVSDLVDAGRTKNVRIKFEEPLEGATDVWAMLHVEDNGNVSYDFPDGDAPAQAGGQAVEVKIHVTVR